MTSSKNTIDPSLGDVVFSIKTFAAAMLALGIALCFDLTNPYWAVGTVYIVAHPLSGASTSKALYRLIGTALGGTVTVILIPNLVNSPELLTLAIALWMAFCLGISLLDRTPRSYSFMLAGYTTARPASDCRKPGYGLYLCNCPRRGNRARHHLCGGRQSHFLSQARRAGPGCSHQCVAARRRRTRDRYAERRGRDPSLLAAARRLAADAVDLHSFTTHVAYDTSALRDIVGRTRILQQRMVAMLLIVSGLADVLHALEKATAGKFTPAITALVSEATALLESGAPLAEDKRQQFLALMAKAEEEGRQQQEWNGLLAHNFTARIRDLVQIWGDCLSLRQDIESGSHHDLRWRRFGTSFDRAPIPQGLRHGHSLGPVRDVGDVHRDGPLDLYRLASGQRGCDDGRCALLHLFRRWMILRR